MDRNFRSFYIGALMVVGIGLVGTSVIPRLHATAGWNKTTTVSAQPGILGDYSIHDRIGTSYNSLLLKIRGTSKRPF